MSIFKDSSAGVFGPDVCKKLFPPISDYDESNICRRREEQGPEDWEALSNNRTFWDEYDWAVFRHFQPALPLAKILEDALKVDEQWKRWAKAHPELNLWDQIRTDERPFSVPIRSIHPDVKFSMDWR